MQRISLCNFLEFDSVVKKSEFESEDDAVVTAAVLANRIAASTRTVGNLAAKGIAVRGPNGRGFYLWASIRNYFQELRSASAGRASVADVRKRVLAAQAQKIERENDVARGEFWPADETLNLMHAQHQRLRSLMLAVPARASQRLPHLTNHDVHEIEQEVIAALFEAVATEKILLDPERVARESAAGADEGN